MRRILAVILFAAGALTTAAVAQQWSAEEQEILTHLGNVLDQIEENNEATHALWRDVVNPRDDLVWWFTDQGAPYDLEALEKWHQGWETRGADYTYLDARPVAVRVIDSVAMVWYYNYAERRESNGEYHQSSEMRLEIFHKTDEGWEFVGGMAAPILPFESE